MAYNSSSADAILSAFQNVQGQRSQLAQYALQKAAVYLQNKKNDEAIKELKKALAFDPQNDTAYTYLGNIYLSQGKTHEAIKSFKDLVRLMPTSVNAHVNLGNAYLQAKQYADSEKEFKFAARLDPLNPVADYTLGHQYLQTDRLKEAEAQFQKVQRVSPRDGNVFYSLGMLYNKQGKYSDAVNNLEKALSLKKNFYNANLELGIAYDGLGEKDKAQKQLGILNQSSPLLAKDLKYILEKPRIVTMDTSKGGGFAELLGPNTKVWTLDPDSLTDANSSKTFSVNIMFSNEMDIASVVSPSNWSITRAKSAQGGYYTATSKEASIPKVPLSVTYNAVTREATVSFRISQNADKDATIDPKHLVFKFSGKDAAGRQMDTTGDEYDGYALKAF